MNELSDFNIKCNLESLTNFYVDNNKDILDTERQLNELDKDNLYFDAVCKKLEYLKAYGTALHKEIREIRSFLNNEETK